MAFRLRRKMISEDGPGWAVTGADGEPLPGRWNTESDACEEGYMGMYLFSGVDVVEIRLTLIETLRLLLEAGPTRQQYVRVQDGVRFARFVNDDDDVISFDRLEGGDLTRADVDWTRAALADLGYDVVAEWLPLTHGVSAGVSFRLQARS